MYSTVEVFFNFTEWLLLWCFQIVFCVFKDKVLVLLKIRSLFNFHKKETTLQFDVEVTWHKIGVFLIYPLCGFNYRSSRKCRNSRSQMFFKIGVLKNFANFTRKQLRWNLFLVKLKALSPETLLKKDSNTGVSLWNL